VLSGFSPDEPWNLNSHGAFARTSSWVELAECLEPVTSLLETELRASGLRIIRRDPECDAALRRAWALIGRVPSLRDVVPSVVTGVLRLQSDDHAVDISHSEPRWGGSVFVSFPPPTPVGDIRLTESIIHEAMHINLSQTEIDDTLPKPEALLYSPWRETLRPVSGVLHGAYVSTCLLRFFDLMVVGAVSPALAEHIKQRRKEILGEFESLPWSKLASSAGEAGRGLCQMMRDYIEHRLFQV
jgi:HEXXH motif-containing protein